MRLPRECYQMQQTLEQHLPQLRPAQIKGLTLWVYGALVAQSACQSAVAAALSVFGCQDTWRQYLREWLYDGSDRAAPCRTQLEVRSCFAPLLRWLLSWWQADRLALAIDPTMQGDRSNALVVSVVYRSCAIPVAWHILPANRPGAWIEPLVDLLGLLAEAVPQHMKVIVLCDRGLRSPRLWRQITALGWHPYIRQSGNTVFCPEGGTRLPARAFVPGPGHAWVGYGTAFRAASKRCRGTLLVVWETDQDEPWIVLTDLRPAQAGVAWYGLRCWIEMGFRALKSVGWQWQKTRRSDPDRIARHWLALSVATLWALAYGTRAEDAARRGLPPGRLRAPPPTFRSPPPRTSGRTQRPVSVLRLGIVWLNRLLHQGRLWRRVWLRPEPWPQPPPQMPITYHYAP